MPTVTAYLRTDQSKTNRFPLYIRIIAGDTKSYKSLGVKIKKSHWDTRRELIKSATPEANTYNEIIATVKLRATQIINEIEAQNQLAKITGKTKTIITADILREKIFNEKGNAKSGKDFIQYSIQNIEKAKAKIAHSTYISRHTAVNRLKEYITEHKQLYKGALFFNEIDIAFVKSFQEHMAGQGSGVKTIGHYCSILRTIFDEAVLHEEIDMKVNPWAKVKPARLKTDKIANPKMPLYSSEFEAFKNVRLPPEEEKYRDYFLFQVYTCGIRVSDLCLTRWQHFYEEETIFKFTMRKTGAPYEQKLQPVAQKIIQKYKTEQNQGFVFPILPQPVTYYTEPDFKTADQRIDAGVKKATKEINKNLKIIGQKAGITRWKTLSTHIARHTFAYMALSAGWSKEALQTAFGHSSITVTENYLKDFRDLTIDKRMAKLWSEE